ncbi:uncharacterized protein itprid2 isoform X2 [Vanacampus margaritifer]
MLAAADVAIATMESPAILLDPVPLPDASAGPNCSLASLRRRAWAKSRESTWQETQKVQFSGSPQRPPQEPLPESTESNGDPTSTPEEPGLAPNKITCWLDQCRTPLGASLDDQSAPASRGATRNGCSFEDDLSLGAEADHLQSINKKTAPCGSLAADQKRSQYKEKGQSMNSTGSGKSSTVSSVSELLDLYEEDPEEILLNLGFGRDEPDMSSKIPSRFFNSSSAARGIDIKVYLGAQLQRMEVENPNYALTSRFRQIEVLTTVANQFIQLYGHVSGQPVQNVGSGSRDQGGEVATDQPTPSLFGRKKSAQNVADRLKKSLSKHNLLTALPGASGRPADKAPPDPAPALPDANEQHADKHVRKKDSCSLATVAEEGHKEQHLGQNGGGGEPESADPAVANRSADDMRAPEKAPAPPQLAQLRTENADSFDMEEIQSNEDEALLSRTSRNSDLLRTASQQSDSSGFAEETSSVDAANFKVQESSDSCDSETTVTSHPSQDVATPVALNQPAFDLPDTRAEESQAACGAEESEAACGAEESEAACGTEESQAACGADESEAACGAEESEAACGAEESQAACGAEESQAACGAEESEAACGAVVEDHVSSPEQEEHQKFDENSKLVPQYKAHQLPKNLAAADEGPELQEGPKEEEEKAYQDDAQKDPPTSELSPSDPLFSDPQLSNPPSSNAPTLQPLSSDPPSSNPPPSNSASLEPLSLDPPHSDPQPSDPPSSSPATLEPPSLDPPPSDPQPLDPPSSNSPSSDCLPSDHPFSLQTADHPYRLPAWDSPVLSALSRVKQRLGDAGPRSSRRRHRGGLPMQRSSSLPSSLLSPSRVVSSVKIQLGPGRAFCSQPHYAFRYIHEPDTDPQAADSPSCISTLVLENSRKSCDPDGAATKAAPCPLLRSSGSLRCASPPTEWPWISQSVPDLSSTQELFGYYRHGGTPVPGPDIVLSPSPSPRPETPVNPSLLYPTPPHPYASLPNLLHPYSNHFAFNPPHLGTPPHYASLWNLPTGTPPMHQYHNYHMAYHSVPHSPPYLGHHGYDLSLFPPLAPDHIAHRSAAPPGPGFLPGYVQGHSPHHGLGNSSHLGHNLAQVPHPGPHLGPYPGVGPGPYPSQYLAHNPHLGLGSALGPGYGPPLGLSPGSGQVLSGTEMQLRRVLHDIRGTVHSLSQRAADASDALPEASCRQAQEQLRQKRRSLAEFRTQMSELELAVVRQQALVYKHLSPADRLEVEQLECLRSAVRDELLELEQQLEDKLMELTQHAGPRKDEGGDETSASSASASALRAVQPLSDLLREQLLLQSELSYDAPAAASSPPDAGPYRPAVYRASINITPAPPPRPRRRQDRDREQAQEGAGRREEEAPEEAGGGAAAAASDHLLITEMGAGVTRRQILNQLWVASGAPRL